MPRSTGIEVNRKLTDFRGELLCSEVATQLFAIDLAESATRRKDLLNQTGLVGEQVLYGDGVLSISYFTSFTVHNFEVGKFRNESFNGVIKVYHAIFDKGHDSHANNRLGHGVDPEDSVLVNRGRAFGALHTRRLQYSNTFAIPNQQQSTGNMIAFYCRLHCNLDLFNLRLINAEVG